MYASKISITSITKNSNKRTNSRTETQYLCTLLPTFAEHYVFKIASLSVNAFYKTLAFFKRSKLCFSSASKLRLTMSLFKLKVTFLVASSLLFTSDVSRILLEQLLLSSKAACYLA